MGYTSKAFSIPGIPIIDVDEVVRTGDPDSYPELRQEQPHGTYSKGMYCSRSDAMQLLERQAKLLDTDGESLELELKHSPYSTDEVRVPYSYGATLPDIPDEYLLDLSDKSALEAMIKESEELGALREVVDLAGLICKDQNGTNYCWGNAPTHCYEVNRVGDNHELVYFSPGSVCGPLTGFRNVGGWGGTALKRIIDAGLCPQDVYPANKTSKPANFEQLMQIAAGYKAKECWNLPTLRSQVSAMLKARRAIALGYDWWRHEVTGYQALWDQGALAYLCRNSWSMSYGDRGYFILRGWKMEGDDGCCLNVASPRAR